MKNLILAGVAGSSLFVVNPSTFAEDDPLTIVITASRSAETVDETMVPVTVIDRKKIEQKQAVTVSDALRDVPGLVVSQSGGVGSTTSVFLRGTESDHVLVLIDGVKVGSATLGSTPFQDLPLDQVEKIEVVRGPRSSLYGSEAIGGVIQIFTRRGESGTRPLFSIGAGSHNTGKLNAGVSGGSEKGWYSVSAAGFTTDGINACRGDFTAGCFTVEPDKDGYDNTSISMSGGYDLTDRLAIEGNVLNSDSETEFDGSFQNESDTVTRLGSVKAVLQATDSWKSSLLIAQTKDESDNFLDKDFTSSFNTTRDQVSWQNTILAAENSQVVAGIDYVDDEVDGTLDYAVNSRDNLGVFALLRTAINANDVELSIRGDDNEQFGSQTTGGIAWGRDIGNGKRVTASWGSAFKAPTFNELYFPGFGNPELGAETSGSFDVGISGSTDQGRWSFNIYQTTIDDLIGFDPTTFLPVNINEAEISGIELTGQTTVAAWDLGATLTLQNPEDTGGGPNHGNLLPRRAEQILVLNADRTFGRYSAGASLHYQGDAYDDLANMVKLDAFTVIDLRGEVRLNRNWAAGLRINNVFDEQYETAAFFNQDGINYMATLRFIPRNR